VGTQQEQFGMAGLACGVLDITGGAGGLRFDGIEAVCDCYKGIAGRVCSAPKIVFREARAPLCWDWALHFVIAFGAANRLFRGEPGECVF